MLNDREKKLVDEVLRAMELLIDYLLKEIPEECFCGIEKYLLQLDEYTDWNYLENRYTIRIREFNGYEYDKIIFEKKLCISEAAGKKLYSYIRSSILKNYIPVETYIKTDKVFKDDSFNDSTHTLITKEGIALESTFVASRKEEREVIEVFDTECKNKIKEINDNHIKQKLL